MFRLSKRVRFSAYIISAVLAALCLFSLQASLILGKSLFNSGLHKKLFEKYDLDSEAARAADKSVRALESGLQKSPDSQGEENIIRFLEASSTPEMVSSNLDILREGLLKYFKGETRFLPDIVLNGSGQAAAGNQAAAGGPPPVPGDLSRLGKINLGAVLQYINRDDIYEDLVMIKLLYHITDSLPLILTALFIFIALLVFILCRTKKDFARWTGIVTAVTGSAGLLTSAAALVYEKYGLPELMHAVKASLPLNESTITGYISDCVNLLSVLSAVTGAVLLIFSAVIFTLALRGQGSLKTVPGAFQKCPDFLNSRSFRIASGMLLLLAFVITTVNFGRFEKDLTSGEYAGAFTRLISNGPVTKVIPASDDTVYILQVRLIDRKTLKPVRGISVEISSSAEAAGTKAESGSGVTAVTDDTGSVRMSLDKGGYNLKFGAESIPPDYRTPSPLYFDLKKAGITMITVPLDGIEAEKPGIAEVEVLDASDNPVEGIEINVMGSGIYSYTNADGVAVFKLNSGNYALGFIEGSIPPGYAVPGVINSEIIPESVSRYTVKLAEKR